MTDSNAPMMLSSMSFALTELYHLKTALTVCGAKWVLCGAEWDFWQSNQEIFT